MGHKIVLRKLFFTQTILHSQDDGNYDAEVQVLAHTLDYFWTNWFRDQYPKAHLKVDFFDDYDELSITVYAER